MEHKPAPQVRFRAIEFGGVVTVSYLNSYVGEVGIWTGIWALSTSSLQTSAYPRGTVAFAAISPLFTWFLIRKVRFDSCLTNCSLTHPCLGIWRSPP